MSWSNADFLNTSPLWQHARARVRSTGQCVVLPTGGREIAFMDTWGSYPWGPEFAGAHGRFKWTRDYNNNMFRAYNRVIPGSYADVGAPFYSEEMVIGKPSFDETSSLYFRGDSLRQARLTGPIWPSRESYDKARLLVKAGTEFDPVPHFPHSAVPSPDELRALGATAISRTLPTVPDAKLSTALGELITGGLPSIVGRQFFRDPNISSTGGEYLNYQFGILPTIADAKSLMSSARKFDKVIEQTKRDSERLVRRKLTLSDTTTTTEETFANRSSYPAETAGTLTRSKTVRQRIWFAGAYRYSYPAELDGLLGKLRDFDRVYGVIPDVDTLYNLTPFSWLVDWFANVGDVYKNASALDKNGLQLAYGYVMCETTTHVVDTHRGVFEPWGSLIPGPLVTTTCEFKQTTKQRMKASPFGFGVALERLSPQQGAILTALGLSRLKM